MKRHISTGLCMLLCTALLTPVFAQIKGYSLEFEHGQRALTKAQKDQIDSLARISKPGERILVYPITFDPGLGQYKFAKTAKFQADLIAAHAQAVGFQHTGTPINIPNAIRGYSVCVGLRLLERVRKVEGLTDRFKPKHSQYFTIDPLRDTILVGEEGTVLYFDAGCLQSSQKVRIELKEFYGLGDVMKNGLPTVSNGRMIQTGGSIYLDATEADNPNRTVRLDPVKGVGLDFTLGKADPGMQVFIKDPSSPDMNWILPGQRRNSNGKGTFRMIETVMDRDGNVIAEHIYNSREEWQARLEEIRREEEERKRRREEQERQLEEEQKAYEALQETEKKIRGKLRSADLGFINCDRFPDEVMQELELAADTIIAEYYLVYQDVRGVMKGSLYGGRVRFGSVPSNRQALLIGVTFIDDQAYYFQSPVKGSDLNYPKVTLRPVSEKYVSEKLAMLK